MENSYDVLAGVFHLEISKEDWTEGGTADNSRLPILIRGLGDGSLIVESILLRGGLVLHGCQGDQG